MGFIWVEGIAVGDSIDAADYNEVKTNVDTLYTDLGKNYPGCVGPGWVIMPVAADDGILTSQSTELRNRIDWIEDNKCGADQVAHNLPVDAGENVGVNVGADSGANTGEDVGENVGANAGANPGENVGEDVGANSGAFTDEDVGENVGANTGEDTGDDSGANVGADGFDKTDYDFQINAADCSPANTGENTGEDVGEDIGANTGEDSPENVGEDSGVNSGADSGADSGEDVGEDVGEDSGAFTGADSPENTGANNPEDTGDDIGANFGAMGSAFDPFNGDFVGAEMADEISNYSGNEGANWGPDDVIDRVTVLNEDEGCPFACTTVYWHDH